MTTLQAAARSIVGRIRLPTWLIALPLPVWLLVFFVVPLALVMRESFYTYENFRVHPDLTVDAYKDTVFNRDFLDLWWKTVRLALIQTVLVVLVIYPYSYAVAFHLPSRRLQLLVIALTVAPFFTSYLMQVYSWQIVLSENGMAHQLSDGLIPTFLRTQTGAHIGLLGFLWPLAALLMYLSLNNIDWRLLEAARNLGAGPLTMFRTVILPLSRPGIILAGMLAFVLSFSDYLSMVVLGGSDTRVLSVPLNDSARIAGNYPAAASISAVMLLTILAAIIISFRFAAAPQMSREPIGVSPEEG
jgi:spermidine/putrescine transport system permease protein